MIIEKKNDSDSVDLTDYYKLVEELPKGKYHLPKPKKIRLPASINQLKYWKGVIPKVVALAWGWEQDEVIQHLQKKFIPIEKKTPDGRLEVLAGSYSSLNTKEAAVVVEAARIYLHQEHGIYIKTPDQWRHDEYYKLQMEYENRFYT